MKNLSNGLEETELVLLVIKRKKKMKGILRTTKTLITSTSAVIVTIRKKLQLAKKSFVAVSCA